MRGFLPWNDRNNVAGIDYGPKGGFSLHWQLELNGEAQISNWMMRAELDRSSEFAFNLLAAAGTG
jgi:hypothetical protein